MQIKFERSGGFMGRVITTELEPASLSEEEQRKIQGLVQAANFFNLPQAIASSNPGADQFSYKITVEMEGEQHTLETGDMSAPESLRELIDYLSQIARSRRLSN